MMIKNAIDIPGQTSEDQHNWYKVIVNWFGDDLKILEVGSAWGRSTWAWLDVLPKNSTLEVVDWWKYDEKALKKQDKLYFKFIKEKFKTYNHYEVFHYHIKQHANYNKLIKINSVNHETFMKENLKTFDIVFLDGTHTYETVYKELNYYKGTKVICGDDYDSRTHRPLVKAVNKFYKKNKKSYELIIDHESRFYIFKKK